MKNTSTSTKIKGLQLSQTRGAMHSITVPDAVAKKLNGERRVVCIIGEVKFHCALQFREERGYFVLIGKGTLQKVGGAGGKELVPQFKRDESKYQFEMPLELDEVLSQDDKASAIFSQLTDGGKRSIIYLVSQLKSEQKRVERALHICEKLKAGITSARTILKK